jgi:hypothetical protein
MKMTRASRQRDRQAGSGRKAVGLYGVDEETSRLRMSCVRNEANCWRRMRRKLTWLHSYEP